MNTIARVALIAGVLAAAWLAMRPGHPPPPPQPLSERRESLVEDQVPAAPAMDAVPSSVDAPAPTSSGQDRVDPQIAEWLARPPARDFRALPRPGEVPVFDAATNAELLRRFRQPESPTNKLTIAYFLALRGGPEVIGEFALALTNTYAGRTLTRDEAFAADSLVGLLGVAGRRHPEALQFLERARDIDFWRGIRLWQVADIDEFGLQRILVSSAIWGTAWSGRPEVEQMLAHYRENPAVLDASQTHGVVADAARIRALVAEQGFERAWELTYLDTWDPKGHAWGSSPEGREWWKWYLGVQARLAGQAKP